METKPGFSIHNLINKVVTRFAKKQTGEVEPKITVDCRNPWQHNLERLSQCTFTAEPTSQTPEMKEFVSTMESVAQEVRTTKQGIPAASPSTTHNKISTAAQEEDRRMAKRTGDQTVQNMSAWWKDALNSTTEPNIANSENSGKPRLQKRWYK